MLAAQREETERATELSNYIRLSGLTYVIPLYVIFAVVDYFWYPEHLGELWIIRSGVLIWVFVAAYFGRSPSQRVMERWVCAYMAGMTWSIHLILFRIGHPDAPYYAGLILIIAGVAAEPVTRWRWYALTMAQVFVPYVVFGLYVDLGDQRKTFVLNLIFMGSVTVVNTVSRWATRRLQVRERSVRSQLEHEINARDQVIGAKTREAVELQEKRARLSEEVARARERMTITEQVAHDIRSPLSALNVTVAHASGLSSDSRGLMMDAVRRIADIADDLATRARSDRQVLVGKALPRLDQLLAQVVAEKRVSCQSDVQIELEVARPACAGVDPSEYQRVVSNLIQNAIEACSTGGGVRIHQDVIAERVILKIMDSGRGIAPELLSHIGQRGLTVGKAGGSGLGVHHAMQFATRAGGQLVLSSLVGRGTDVTLTLPAVPVVFLTTPIDLTDVDQVVIVDDDPEIARAWRARLNIPIEPLRTAQELRTHVKSRNPSRRSKYLIDFDLGTHGGNGLELIEELGLAPYAILVTGRHADPEVQTDAGRLGIRVIAKSLINDLEIQISS